MNVIRAVEGISEIITFLPFQQTLFLPVCTKIRKDLLKRQTLMSTIREEHANQSFTLEINKTLKFTLMKQEQYSVHMFLSAVFK